MNDISGILISYVYKKVSGTVVYPLWLPFFLRGYAWLPKITPQIHLNA